MQIEERKIHGFTVIWTELMRKGLTAHGYLWPMSAPRLFPNATTIEQFCAENAGKNALELRLKKSKSADYDLLISQLEVRSQMSERFAPLIERRGYLFPPKARLSQASSCATALWRGQELAKHLPSGARIWDVTGGSGIDTWGLEEEGFQTMVTEPDPHLAALLVHNGTVLGVQREVQHCASESFMPTNALDAIYVDPSRLDEAGKRVYHPADCFPNALTELPRWLSLASNVWIKLSPMVDPNEALKWFPGTRSLYLLSVGREMKEVFLHVQDGTCEFPARIAVDLNANGSEHYRIAIHPQAAKPSLSAPKTYLYDADAALVAGRAIPSLAGEYSLHQLHPESRLLTSDTLHPGFPGRIFQVDAIHTPFKGDWPFGASVVVRGYPEKADQIRKRMKLKENAEHYLLATVWGENERGFIAARRLGA